MTRYRPARFERSPLRWIAAAPARMWHGARIMLARIWQRVWLKPILGDEERVLVFRLGSIGDHIAAWPALAAIRTRHAQAKLLLMTNAATSPPWPEQVGTRCEIAQYRDAGDLRAQVRRFAPGAVYFLAPYPLTLRRAMRDALFFRLCGVRRGVGFTPVDATGCTARALRPWVVAKPEFDRISRACGEQPRIENWSRPLEPLAGIPAGAVAMAATGKFETQHWPIESWRGLAKSLRAAGIPVVWLGDARDAKRIAEAGLAEPGEDRAGQLDVQQSFAAIRACRAVVANDSGLAHAAAAMGVLVVVIASSRNTYGAWTPAGDPARVRVLRSDVACEACSRNTCPSLICLRLIEPANVLAALAEMGVAVTPSSSGAAT